MGGYGLYVWTSYVLALLILALNLYLPWRRHHRVLRELRGRLRREGSL